MTSISIHDATQEEYDWISTREWSNVLDDSSRWKKVIFGSVEITIFAPYKEEQDATDRSS